MTRSTHECAADGCTVQVKRALLMCRSHWFKVPKPIRDEVWRAYREEGVLSEAYVGAVEAAQESLR